LFKFTALYTALQNQEEPKLHSPQMAKLSNACERRTPGRLTTEITTKMKDNYSINLIIPTPKHCLKDVGLHGKCPAKKPFILGKNQKLHLQFAKKHENWTSKDWAKRCELESRSSTCLCPMVCSI
jgi:hypothetical protein